MPVFLEDNFLILEHKAVFGFVLYPSSVLIYQNRPLGRGTWTTDCPVSWSVKHNAIKRQSHRLPRAQSVPVLLYHVPPPLPPPPPPGACMLTCCLATIIHFVRQNYTCRTSRSVKQSTLFVTTSRLFHVGEHENRQNHTTKQHELLFKCWEVISRRRRWQPQRKLCPWNMKSLGVFRVEHLFVICLIYSKIKVLQVLTLYEWFHGTHFVTHSLKLHFEWVRPWRIRIQIIYCFYVTMIHIGIEVHSTELHTSKHN